MIYLPQHHPDETLLAEFAAGSLDPAQAMAISAHLHFCPKCRSEVQHLETIATALFESSENPTAQAQKDPVLTGSFDTLMQRIDTMENQQHSASTSPTTNPETKPAAKPVIKKEIAQKYASLPRSIGKLLTKQAPKWKTVTQCLKSARLLIGQDKYAISLQKILAGGRIPEHDHRGDEITIVLQGSFSDEDGIYQQGDFLLRQAGDIHRPVASTDQDCLCLSVETAPVKLTGLRGWLLNPFIRIQPG